MKSILEALEARPLPARVAQVLDHRRVVINRGAKDGMQVGRRFLIFGIGPDILDPETGQSLGHVELVRGTGTVTHVQDLQATIESDMTQPSERRVVKQPFLNPYRLFAPGGLEETVYSTPVPRSFEDPDVGDYAKPI